MSNFPYCTSLEDKANGTWPAMVKLQNLYLETPGHLDLCHQFFSSSLASSLSLIPKSTSPLVSVCLYIVCKLAKYVRSHTQIHQIKLDDDCSLASKRVLMGCCLISRQTEAPSRR